VRHAWPTAFILLLLVVAGCQDIVVVRIDGPVALAGAEVRVDGKLETHMAGFRIDPATGKSIGGDVSGSTATLKVSTGVHEITVVKPGLKPLVLQRNYSKRGEDYIGLYSEDLVRDEHAFERGAISTDR